mgnify:CR=1 FL=1
MHVFFCEKTKSCSEFVVKICTKLDDESINTYVIKTIIFLWNGRLQGYFSVGRISLFNFITFSIYIDH